MTELINLRTARKRARRRHDEIQAAANRFAHGEPKHLRKLEAAREQKAALDLDQRRIDKGDSQ